MNQKPKYKPASTQSAYKQTEIGMIPEEWKEKEIILRYLKLQKERIWI